MQFYLSVLTQTLITIIGVAGVYVLTSLAGMFSLGQAAFMAIGAYASGILVVKLNWPFLPAAIIAVLISVIIGFFVGLPTVKLRRDYISLVTLGFGEALTAILNQMTGLTGGAAGFSGFPKVISFPIVLVVAIICVILVAFFKKSKYGRQCIALKGDELAAKAMGINVPKVKMIAFLFSVALVSLSGVLYAFYVTYVDPTLFGWKLSGEWVIMNFFGGVSSLTGSILSAVILTALPEMLRFLSDFRMVFYAVVVLLVLNFKPAGLLGTWELTPKNVKKLFQKKKEGTHASSGK
ncbi:branched-chain amino acid ABC transporter permease [Anaerocolumna aminovalerica]|uniref:branched-chain amino acid ABC transporter permease n=1 Tax=Anaerocolumna aminovalerica TaxID=1527 RepID=UPI00248CC232|nr:branched-chain amino acid ABC transporter permease [Anaerocolumna aminovalerica]